MTPLNNMVLHLRKVKQTSNNEVVCLSERAINTQAYQKFNNCIKLDINILFKLVKINRGSVSILSRRCECFFFSLNQAHVPKKDRSFSLKTDGSTEKALSCITRPGHYAASPPIWWMEYSAPLLFPMPSFGPRLWWWGKPSPRFSVTYLHTLLSVSWKLPLLGTTECCSLVFILHMWHSVTAYFAMLASCPRWLCTVNRHYLEIGIITSSWLFRLVVC